MYKHKDKEKYKTTTIRIKQEHYDLLKCKAIRDNRSVNYTIVKILIDYILTHPDLKEYYMFQSNTIDDVKSNDININQFFIDDDRIEDMFID